MIFIDWISAPNHTNFNKAFFQSIQVDNLTYLAFHNELRISDVNCNISNSKSGRFNRFFEIVKTTWKYRSQRIFLLSYDPLLVPLLTLYTSKVVFVFEHNTTPPVGSYLKILFQFLFYRRLFRFSQFPAQQKHLQRFTKRSAYLGSPLQRHNDCLRQTNATEKLTLIYPSPRADISELLSVASDLLDHEIIVKHELVKSVLSKLPENVTVLNRLNLEDYRETVLVFLIALETEIRGSGWFNEAIAHNAIVVHLNDESYNLFADTFPHFQSYHIKTFKSILRSGKLSRPNNPAERISSHNRALLDRFHKVIER